MPGLSGCCETFPRNILTPTDPTGTITNDRNARNRKATPRATRKGGTFLIWMGSFMEIKLIS
jgi:hypothetical protein